MASTFFLLKIAPAEVRRLPPVDRTAYYRLVVEYGLKRKDWELARGLNARGEPMPPVKPATREHRRSEMTASGKGDPHAPYLMPGRGLSRTRSLLAGKAHADYAEFWWRYDAYTGDQWGRVLAAHARRGKAYDVVGLSAKGKAWVAAKALAAWRKGVRIAAPVMDDGPVEVDLVGRTNLDYATEGIGGTLEQAKRAIAEGRSSGFLSEDEWRKHYRQARPAIVGAAPGTSYSVRSGASNVLLQHVWGGSGKPPAASMARAAMGPKTPPKPSKAEALELPTVDRPSRPIADASYLLTTSAPSEARPKEFEGPADREAWVARTYGDGRDGAWWNRLTREQRDAVKEYSGSASGQINDYIRRENLGGGSLMDATYTRMTRMLDSALATQPTPEAIVAYRGVEYPAPILRAMGVDSIADVRVGMRFPDPGFTSTSLDPIIAEKFGEAARFKVVVPQGSDAAYIGANSSNDHEREFLLGRSLDLFEVVGFEDGWIVLRAIKSGG